MSNTGIFICEWHGEFHKRSPGCPHCAREELLNKSQDYGKPFNLVKESQAAPVGRVEPGSSRAVPSEASAKAEEAPTASGIIFSCPHCGFGAWSRTDVEDHPDGSRTNAYRCAKCRGTWRRAFCSAQQHSKLADAAAIAALERVRAEIEADRQRFAESSRAMRLEIPCERAAARAAMCGDILGYIDAEIERLKGGA